MEAADSVEHGVQREVLSGRDVNLAGPSLPPNKPASRRARSRNEIASGRVFPLRRERRAPPGPALLVVQRHWQVRFE